jgi:hypothetical protein
MIPIPPTISETEAIAMSNTVRVFRIPNVEVVLLIGAKMMPIAKHSRCFLTCHFHRVLRDGRAQDVV